MSPQPAWPTDPRIGELLDREAIRSVLHEYCRVVDRGDAALMKACYHPDATDDHGFFVGGGWDFADYVLPILAQLECSIHSLTNPHIRLDGDKAHVEAQWSVILRRIAVHDAERWIDTADLQRLVPDSHPHKVYRGCRGAADRP